MNNRKKNLLFLGFSLLSLTGGVEKSFAGEKVCVSKADFNRIDFNFQIRSAKQGCQANERELEMKREADGTLLFLPPDSSPPSSTTKPAQASPKS